MERPPTELELIEMQIKHEINAGERDGAPLPIVAGRRYKVEMLKIIRDKKRRES